ncbi:MAG: N-acetyl-gamma-glutamyl-phosphate reductase [Bacteroidales bacterium]|nr:N-acetyl-gamma-glutamyl-phosphate reductase [Bacteroidales bacterium]
MVKVGIIGAAGYTGGELIRVLLGHPDAKIVFAQSTSHAGEPLWKAHSDLVGETEIVFSADAPVMEADVVFLCGGHGNSKDTVASFPQEYKGAIIDLANDFRLAADAGDFVYGLTDAFKDKIEKAKHIANPGCFATSIQLALLPLAAIDKLGEVHVTAITGSTGAGQKLQDTTQFSWRSNNMSVYKAFSHQHLAEIKETLKKFSPDWCGKINFVPVRGDFARGIMASVYMDCDIPEDQAVSLYKAFYQKSPFVTVVDSNPDLKMVVNTNKAVLYVRKYGDKIHIISMIDNLLKGASGQAVENMNIMFGLPQDAGLRLKASKF